MQEKMGHEKLRVYQFALEHAAWMHAVLTGIAQSAVVLDHWDRAAVSIIEGLANGNSRRSRADRNRFFDVAIGSALECAACLDICRCRSMISNDQMNVGKKLLQAIVRMTIGLRDAQSSCVREDQESYDAKVLDIYFAHEGLDVYKSALKLIAWVDGFTKEVKLSSSLTTQLDKSSTSLVLNIAEGNGRFSEADQMRFLDIAHTCAMQVAACLDVLVARQQVKIDPVDAGKRILARVVPLLLGLRGYLDETVSKGLDAH
jgi:four helix bundle protein